MGNFKKLNVWIKSKDLAVEIYRIAKNNDVLSRDFRLRDQMTSSAVSISSNIAEGDELDTQKQSIRFFYYSKGSFAELMTQIIICKELKIIEEKKADQLIDTCEHISAMLNKLIKVRSNIPNK